MKEPSRAAELVALISRATQPAIPEGFTADPTIPPHRSLDLADQLGIPLTRLLAYPIHLVEAGLWVRERERAGKPQWRFYRRAEA